MRSRSTVMASTDSFADCLEEGIAKCATNEDDELFGFSRKRCFV